eukprot:NODE_131_length_16689_cov_0.437914.p19 type:complete len:109 gc:universal NODE_131_length_16689_cov_0.437914:14705-14379(-)
MIIWMAFAMSQLILELKIHDKVQTTYSYQNNNNNWISESSDKASTFEISKKSLKHKFTVEMNSEEQTHIQNENRFQLVHFIMTLTGETRLQATLIESDWNENKRIETK